MLGCCFSCCCLLVRIKQNENQVYSCSSKQLYVEFRNKRNDSLCISKFLISYEILHILFSFFFAKKKLYSLGCLKSEYSVQIFSLVVISILCVHRRFAFTILPADTHNVLKRCVTQKTVTQSARCESVNVSVFRLYLVFLFVDRYTFSICLFSYEKCIKKTKHFLLIHHVNKVLIDISKAMQCKAVKRPLFPNKSHLIEYQNK